MAASAALAPIGPDDNLPSFGGIPGGPRAPKVKRMPTVQPLGPRLYQQVEGKTIFRIVGPGTAPPGFKVASTSLSEWYFYWASMRVLDPRRDPRRPPYNGGLQWLYQSSELGAFTRQKGSAVIDFFYKTQYPYLAVRLQTFRFHLAADSLKQAYDRKQLRAIAGYFDVIDVYEGDFINDPTGEAAILCVKQALGLIQRVNPIAAGTVYMVRNFQR